MSSEPKADTNIIIELCKKYNKDFNELHDLITAIRRADFETRQSQTVSFPIDIKHHQLLPFVKSMDEVLTKNDHKGGWQDCDIKYLQARLVEEMGEYFALVAKGSPYVYGYEKAKKELTDIANFCMMLWDRS